MPTLVNIICNHCGTIIQITLKKFNSKRKSDSKHFCSKECRYAHFKHDKIKINCKICNVEFEILSGRLPRRKYCSPKCRMQGKRKDQSDIYQKQCIDCEKIIIYKTYDTYISQSGELRCRSCAAKLAYYAVPLNLREEINAKIATTVSAGMMALTLDQRRCRMKNFIDAGLKANKSGNVSKLETILESVLGPLGFIHNKGFLISISGTYPDYVNEDKKLLIEIHGDYWHCNPIKYDPNWTHPIKKQSASQIWDKDKQRIFDWSQKGYKTLVIWELDIKKNLPKVIENINEWIN